MADYRISESTTHVTFACQVLSAACCHKNDRLQEASKMVTAPYLTKDLACHQRWQCVRSCCGPIIAFGRLH
jgi:hypothetical protein